MTSEVCPFCGKLFKRLKTHLPHCKAAPQTPAANPEASTVPTSIKQQSPTFSASSAKEKKPIRTSSLKQTSQPKKDDGVLAFLDSAPAKKKKPADPTTAIHTSVTLPPPLSTVKSKKKTHRDSIEVTKYDDLKESPGGIKPLSKNTKSCLKTLKDTETQTHKAKEHVDDVFVAPKYKELKPKRTPREQSTSKNVKERPFRTKAEKDLKVNDDVELEDVIELNSKLRATHPAKVTLQDVKATLGRTGPRRGPGMPDALSCTDLSRLPPENLVGDGRSLDSAAVWLEKPSGPREAGSVQRELGQIQNITAASRPEPSTVQRAAPLLLPQGDRLRLLAAPLLTPKLPHTCNPLHFPPAAQSLRGRVEELQLRACNQNAASKPNEGTLSLGDVRLKELPGWLIRNAPTHPREVVELVQKGWRCYSRKYIEVKKGGIGGVSMLLAGYCVLSYIWRYPELKKERWRKYH